MEPEVAQFLFIVFAGLATTIYFIPTAIAVVRSHPQWLPIFVLNLVAGWTFAGWVGALVWSVMPVRALDGAQRS